jgi:hypothetical protein
MSEGKNLPPVVGGIDTLYFFADISGDNYNKIYNDLILNERFFDGFKFLGYSGKNSGFVGSWFKYSIPAGFKLNGKSVNIDLFRVGFKNPDKQKNVKNVYFQLYAEGIYYYGLEDLLQYIDELFTSFGLSPNGYYVSRADINMFVAYDFSDVKKEMFKVPSRIVKITENQDIVMRSDTKVHTFTAIDRLETIYFGSKKSDLHFKMYDKFKELKADSVKFVVLDTYLKNNGFPSGVSDLLWNIEFSLKRNALLSYGIDTISDLLLKAGSVFKDLMSKYVFLGYDVDKIERFRKSRHLNRLSPFYLWEYFINSYDRFSVVPVKRQIKKYRSNIEENRFNALVKILDDLSSIGVSPFVACERALVKYRKG